MQSATSGNKAKFIEVLDASRSRNVNISLTRLPAPRYLKAAIQTMDGGHINKESVEVGSLVSARYPKWLDRQFYSPLFGYFLVCRFLSNFALPTKKLKS